MDAIDSIGLFATISLTAIMGLALRRAWVLRQSRYQPLGQTLLRSAEIAFLPLIVGPLIILLFSGLYWGWQDVLAKFSTPALFVGLAGATISLLVSLSVAWLGPRRLWGFVMVSGLAVLIAAYTFYGSFVVLTHCC